VDDWHYNSVDDWHYGIGSNGYHFRSLEKKHCHMTNANDPLTDNDESSREGAGDTSASQSLTDLIDQLDRAAFKRALASRDDFKDSVPSRSTRNR